MFRRGFTTFTTGCYAYDAFGSVVANAGTTSNMYLYRGEQFDPALGSYYLRARWMNPQTGRFITADQWEGEASQPSSLNRYIYADADPSNHVDPSGFNSDSLVLRAWHAELDLLVVAQQVVIAAEVTCILTEVCSTLDNAAVASGGARTLPENFWPECQNRGQKNCRAVYPEYVPKTRLYNYPFASFSEARRVLVTAAGEDLRNGPPRDATDGPCGLGSGYVVGKHTNMYFTNRDSIRSFGRSAASIVYCKCCDDSGQEPQLRDAFGIANSRVEF
jgi:RHS repeat-associated protein